MDIQKRWERVKAEYKRYLIVERRLSENTVAAYMRDYDDFMHYVLRLHTAVPKDVTSEIISK